MKKYLLILLSATTLLMAACAKRKDCCVLPKNDQFITAEKSGVQWQAPPSASMFSQDTVSVYAGNFKTGFEENFSFFFKVSTTAISYTLKGNQAYYFNTVGRDVSVSGYKLDDTFTNQVTVTSYDQSTKTITGTFQMKFIKTYDNPTGSYPDKVSFLNGKFRVVLPNK
jgi:hypothetical protein